MKMPLLKEKDLILIVAPAGALKQEDINPTIQLLKEKGYEVALAPNIFKQYFYGYNYAGTPEERIKDFQWAIDHPHAKAIWCARGGYGGVQIIDNLDWCAFKEHPKWVIGYSDNTVFHQYLSREGYTSLHGMTVKWLNKDQSPDSFDTVMKALNTDHLKYSVATHSHNNTGEIKARISGGNLSILYSLIHSKTIDNFKDKILFIEDWQENWYHLDRMLMGLMRAKVFHSVSGLIVGSFTKMDVKEENPNYNQAFDEYSYQIIADYFKDFDIPKCFGFSSGHITDNKAIIMGKKATLKVKKEKVLLEI